MKLPPQLLEEDARLGSLEALEVLDTPPEERFDRITRLAQVSLDMPIALLSLVDRERQWFKSVQGLGLSETSREVSFCAHAIAADDTFVVVDAHDDHRFADNPLVLGDPSIRFYAGAPVHAPDGHRVGTLCVIDTEPRRLDARQLRTLCDLALIAENELRTEYLTLAEQDLRMRLASAERRAMVDALTRVWRRGTILDMLGREVERSRRSKKPLSALMIDIDHFKNVNDSHGHPVGDTVLAEVARRIQRALRSMDAVGRYGGEEFLAVLPECSQESAHQVAERVRESVAASPIVHASLSLDLTVSVGVATVGIASSEERSATELVTDADRALYDAKHAGRNRVVAAR